MLFRKRRGRESLPTAPQLPLTGDVFIDGWRRVIAENGRRFNAEKAKPIHMSVMPHAAQWVNGELIPHDSHKNTPEQIYGTALLMGAFCLYAGLQAKSERAVREVHLVAPDGQLTHLPRMSAYADTPGNISVAIRPTATVWSADVWAAYHDLRREEAVHAGLHILGMLAVMPESSGLVAHAPGTRPYIIGHNFSLAGVRPFPHDINNIQPPRQPA